MESSKFPEACQSHKNKIMHTSFEPVSSSGNLTSRSNLKYIMFYNSEKWKLPTCLKNKVFVITVC